jgi:hypothetical protein
VSGGDSNEPIDAIAAAPSRIEIRPSALNPATRWRGDGPSARRPEWRTTFRVAERQRGRRQREPTACGRRGERRPVAIAAAQGKEGSSAIRRGRCGGPGDGGAGDGQGVNRTSTLMGYFDAQVAKVGRP